MNGPCAVTRDSRGLPALLPQEDRKQEAGSRLSADAGSTGALIMGPSSLQSCEKYMSVVYKLPALVFCYTSPNRLKHWPRSSCQTVLVLNAVGSF